MNTLEYNENLKWVVLFSLGLWIIGTGFLTFLWILERLIKERVTNMTNDTSKIKGVIKRKTSARHAFKIHQRKFGGIERGKRAFDKVIDWHAERLVKSGMPSQFVQKRAKQWCFTLLSVSIFLLIQEIKHPEKALLFSGILLLYFGWTTHVRIERRKHTFVTGVYKIYRHMALQISSGMTSAEAIKYLHESVEEPFLKEAMYRFSSCYFKTMDLDLSLNELTERIEGDEVQVLATVLRQGLQTGDSYEMIIKQEQLMVKRYYAALSAESDRIRTKGILIAIALCILIFILLAAPMVYEMGRATQSIFLGQ